MNITLTNCSALSSDEVVTGVNVVVRDGMIIAIGSDSEPEGETVDCRGHLLIPGLIDAHVHSRDPGNTEKEDFEHLGLASARGGVTTICDIQSTEPPTTSRAAVDAKREAAKKSIVNTNFFVCPTPENLDQLKELSGLRDIVGAKIYLAASIGSIVSSYEILRETLQKFRGVVAVHAEDNGCINDVKDGAGEPMNPVDYMKARPEHCAIEAVAKALTILESTTGKLHVCHVTTKGEVDLIRHAKQRGLNVTCEVTPHHLYFTAESANSLGARAKVNPPLRIEEDREALWSALIDGTIDFIATDHAPHTITEKAATFAIAPAGMPGIETMLPVVLTEGRRRKVSVQRLVAAMTIAPATRYGLDTRGRLEVGCDADLTLVDLETKRKVNREDLQTKCGWSPFEGENLRGWPVLTMVGGKIVYNALEARNK